MARKIFFLISLIYIVGFITGCGGNEASIPPIQPYGSLSGAVYSDETREPIPNATVTIEKVSTSQVTDGKGKFFFSRVPAGNRKITIQATGYKEYTDTILIEKDTENTYDAYLEIAYGTLSGTITDSNGNLIVGANVVVGGSYSGISDTNGYYEISNIPIGTYPVAVTATGYSPYTTSTTIEEGTNSLDIQLTPNIGTVAGVVTDAGTGMVIPGAIVSIGGGHTATTDSNGYYEISNIQTGTYPIVVMADGYEDYTGTITVQSGYQVNNVELTPESSGGDTSGGTSGGTTGTTSTGGCSGR